MRKPLATCPHCGELRHPDLCEPALRSMLAEEVQEHAEEHAELERLARENARLRRQIERTDD